MVVADSIRAVVVDKAPEAGRAPVAVWVVGVVAVDKARGAGKAPGAVWVVVEVATTAVAEIMVQAAVAETMDPVAVDPVAVDPVAVGPVVVGAAQVPSLPKHGHGQPRTSKPLASTKLNPDNSKSTVFWNSSTRASRPTSMDKKSNSCPL